MKNIPETPVINSLRNFEQFEQPLLIILLNKSKDMLCMVRENKKKLSEGRYAVTDNVENRIAKQNEDYMQYFHSCRSSYECTESCYDKNSNAYS
jgi:hypothetical protein